MKDQRYSFGVRQALLNMKSMDDQNRIVIEQGHSSLYLQELGDSLFSICPSGWSLWSPRIFESIITATIPVVFSDGIRLPFESDISYRDMIIKINNENVYHLQEILASYSNDQLERKRKYMLKVRKHFVWNDPPLPNDAFHMTILQLRRKISEYKPIGYDEF